MDTNPSSIRRVSPRDVFIHILTIITLYTAAGSFITLLFQYINKLAPDVLSPEAGLVALGPLRFAVSSLLIVFPAFVAASWFLNKGYIQDSSKRESRLRKWLIYFTLFAAALIVLGDLVRLVYEFLGGGITLIFILKSLSFLLVAGTIFVYYFWDVRRKVAEFPKPVKYFVKIVCGAVAAATIGGFFIIGSPQNARLRLFDSQRISHLQSIQWQIINYWQSKGKLPAQLLDLRDPIAGFVVPLDPETNASYEYSVRGETAFEICATFNLPGSLAVIYSVKSQDQNWAHAKGRACFGRTIDKDLYPVRLK